MLKTLHDNDMNTNDIDGDYLRKITEESQKKMNVKIQNILTQCEAAAKSCKSSLYIKNISLEPYEKKLIEDRKIKIAYYSDPRDQEYGTTFSW